MERNVNDRTMRIGLFYPHTHTPHIRSKVVQNLVPNVFDLEVQRRLATVCEAGGLDFFFALDCMPAYAKRIYKVPAGVDYLYIYPEPAPGHAAQDGLR